MIQRAVKLSKQKRKGDRNEEEVSHDTESDLPDIEDEGHIAKKTKKATARSTVAKKCTKT